MRKSTQFLYNLAEADYNLGMSLSKIELKYGINRGKFTIYLKAKGVEVINTHNALKFDNTVFDVIDTEEKAYWLGFMFADGYVSSRDTSMELTLKLSDKGHLEKFLKFLKYNKPVAVDHFRGRVSFANRHIREQLIRHGCTPKKSLTLKFPTTIPEDMVHHFIRGYFDGDGCFHIHTAKSGKKGLSFSVLGTKEFLDVLKPYINYTRPLYRNKSHLNNTFFLSNTLGKAVKVGDYMYKDATIFLERKYNIYSQFAVLYRNE